MMSEPQLNDPVFYDDSDYVDCSECGDWYDYNKYQSNSCESCENKQVEQERANAKAIPSSL